MSKKKKSGAVKILVALLATGIISFSGLGFSKRIYNAFNFKSTKKVERKESGLDKAILEYEKAKFELLVEDSQKVEQQCLAEKKIKFKVQPEKIIPTRDVKYVTNAGHSWVFEGAVCTNALESKIAMNMNETFIETCKENSVDIIPMKNYAAGKENLYFTKSFLKRIFERNDWNLLPGKVYSRSQLKKHISGPMKYKWKNFKYNFLQGLCAYKKDGKYVERLGDVFIEWHYDVGARRNSKGQGFNIHVMRPSEADSEFERGVLNENREANKMLAEYIIREARDTGVKGASLSKFYEKGQYQDNIVLIANSCPYRLLIEVGNLVDSNHRSKKYQQKVARAVVNGSNKYFRENVGIAQKLMGVKFPYNKYSLK